MRTLLTIDWDYFVNIEQFNLSPVEIDFCLNEYWDIMEYNRGLSNEIKTTGEEVGFWDKIGRKLDISGVKTVDVSDSHKLAWHLAIENDVDEVISIDHHLDIRPKESEYGIVGCGNWLGELFYASVIRKATIVLNKDSEWDSINGIKIKNANFMNMEQFIEKELSDIEIVSIHICRSGAWAPPWLDKQFKQFVADSGKQTKVYSDLKNRSFPTGMIDQENFPRNLKGMEITGIGHLIELCGSCDEEVKLQPIFQEQICPNCGERILPCSECLHMRISDCTGKCPLW